MASALLRRLSWDNRTSLGVPVDPDTQEVLVLRRRLDEVTDVGHELSRRAIAPKVQLGQLARGQLISKVVTRHANRLATLSTSRSVMTSVSSQNGDWSMLKAPLRVTDVKAWRLAQQEAPPVFLRPRVVAEALHVVEVARVLDVLALPAEQAVVALLEDLAGHQFEAVVRHRTVAPHALKAAARAFSRPVRFVSGELLMGSHGPVMEVLAISGDGVVEVPDLAGPGDAPSLADARENANASALTPVLRTTRAALEDALLDGVRATKRLESAREQLRDHGLQELSTRLHDATHGASVEARAIAWLEAAVLLELVLDAA